MHTSELWLVGFKKGRTQLDLSCSESTKSSSFKTPSMATKIYGVFPCVSLAGVATSAPWLPYVPRCSRLHLVFPGVAVSAVHCTLHTARAKILRSLDSGSTSAWGGRGVNVNKPHRQISSYSRRYINWHYVQCQYSLLDSQARKMFKLAIVVSPH